jgi:hypothetical protein
MELVQRRPRAASGWTHGALALFIRFCLAFTWVVPALSLGAAVTACSGGKVVFVTAYDEQTDEGVTLLQRKTDALFLALKKAPFPDYASTAPVYAEIHSDIAALKMRNEVRDKNDLTVKQIVALGNAFTIFEGQHKGGTLNEFMVDPGKMSIDQIYRAILKLEIAKKEPKE